MTFAGMLGIRRRGKFVEVGAVAVHAKWMTTKLAVWIPAPVLMSGQPDLIGMARFRSWALSTCVVEQPEHGAMGRAGTREFRPGRAIIPVA